jgi:hypothetical protein
MVVEETFGELRQYYGSPIDKAFENFLGQSGLEDRGAALGLFVDRPEFWPTAEDTCAEEEARLAKLKTVAQLLALYVRQLRETMQEHPETMQEHPETMQEHPETIETAAPVEQGQGNVITPAMVVATVEQAQNKATDRGGWKKLDIYDKKGNYLVNAYEFECILYEGRKKWEAHLLEEGLGLGDKIGAEELSDAALDTEMDEGVFAADKEEQKLRDRLEEIDAEDDGRNDHENFYYDPD